MNVLGNVQYEEFFGSKELLICLFITVQFLVKEFNNHRIISIKILDFKHIKIELFVTLTYLATSQNEHFVKKLG